MNAEQERTLLLWAEVRWRIAFWLVLVAMVLFCYAFSRDKLPQASCGARGVATCGTPRSTFDERSERELALRLGRPVEMRRGERSFKTNCAACHKMDKDMTGPALKSALANAPQPPRERLRLVLMRSDSLIQAKDPYMTHMRAIWSEGSLWRHPNELTPADLEALMDYIEGSRPAH